MLININKKSTSWFFTFCFVILWCNNVLANYEKGGILKELKGNVQTSSDNGISWKLASNDSNVNQGDFIRTGENSFAKVVLYDDSKISINENSMISLNINLINGEEESPNSVMLFLGHIWNSVTKSVQGDESSFIVQTPTSICGVRGTEFAVMVSPDDGTTFTGVSSGEVEVKANGESKILKPNN